jgi:hypothetical protein
LGDPVYDRDESSTVGLRESEEHNRNVNVYRKSDKAIVVVKPSNNEVMRRLLRRRWSEGPWLRER